MRTEPFTEELPVKLDEDERNVRGRQTARLKVALAKHKERAKEVKKKLADEEKELEAALHRAARAAEDGEELRQVDCKEILRGVMVEKIRLDTNETVDARPATKAELEGDYGDQAAAKPKAKKAKPAPAGEPDDGIVDDDYRPGTH